MPTPPSNYAPDPGEYAFKVITVNHEWKPARLP
jgi:hypothetical protein